ncbi:MAG: AEC family transporter [Lawsonibacter sp.]
MELSVLLLGQILVMMVMVLVGVVMAKCRLVNGEESRIISRVVVYVITPCTLLDAFQTELDRNKLEGLLASFLAAVLIYAAFLGVTWLLSRGPHPLTPGEQVCVVYSNSGNLIIPIILNTLGSEFVIYSCAYLVVQNLMTWTHGQMLLGGSQKLTVKQVVTNPCMCGIFLGLAMFFLRVQLPNVLGSAVSALGACLGPISMLVIGVMLAEADLKQAFSSLAIYRVIALRLIVYPLLAGAILWGVASVWWGRGDVTGALTVMLLCAIGPSATTLTQMAQMYRNPESGYMSSINAVTTVLCSITMPVMIFLFQLLPK